jgi:hypothetical protein
MAIFITFTAFIIRKNIKKSSQLWHIIIRKNIKKSSQFGVAYLAPADNRVFCPPPRKGIFQAHSTEIPSRGLPALADRGIEGWP